MAALGRVSEASRDGFFEEHAQLRAQGRAVGEELPQITRDGVLAIVHEAVQTAKAEAVQSAEAESVSQHPSCSVGSIVITWMHENDLITCHTWTATSAILA